MSNIKEEELLSNKLEYVETLDPLESTMQYNNTEQGETDSARASATPLKKQTEKNPNNTAADSQKRADGDDKFLHILNKKKTEKLAREQKVIDYFKSNNYSHLKLEAKYCYSSIPQQAFDSTLEVLPVHLTQQKDRADVERSSKLLDQQTQMIYNVVSLKQKKISKKKVKPADYPMKTSQSLSAPSMPPSTSSHYFSEEDDSDLQTSSLSTFDKWPASESIKLHSEAKQRRDMQFRENELYVRRKPFPIRESERKYLILQDHNRVIPYSSISYSLRRSNTQMIGGQQRRDRSRFNDFIEEFEVLNEKFNEEVAATRKEFKEFSRAKELIDYSVLYRSIRQTDHAVGRLEKYNWSGNQLFSDKLFTLSQTEKCVNSLNRQETNIWMPHFSGFLISIQRYSKAISESNFMVGFMIGCVLLNTLVLAADGFISEQYEDVLSALNLFFTVAFTLEVALKLVGLGVSKFSIDLFNIFDALVVTLSLFEVAFTSNTGGGKQSATSAFRAIRIFRFFRVLRMTRLLRTLRFMKVIIQVISGTLEQFVYIACLMFLFVFIFSLLGMQIFGGSFPFLGREHTRYNYDSFVSAFYTTFIVLTLENWNEVLYNCLRSSTTPVLTIAYLLSWIFIGNYIFLNLFLAVLLDGFESSESLQLIEELEQEESELEAIHKRIIAEIELKKSKEEEVRKKAAKEITDIILPDRQASSQQQVMTKEKGCYLVIRDEQDDEESLEDIHSNLHYHIEEKLKVKSETTDPYVGVDCNRALFYFTKKNPIRLACARIVSNR